MERPHNIMYQPFEGAEILPVPSDVQAMYNWAASRGVKWPKIVYPVRFPPGYIGSMATDTIEPGEAVVVAPNSALVTTNVAFQSELKPIFQAHPEVFREEPNLNDDLVLSTYLLYEKSKGPASDIAPFIAYQPKEPSNLQDWRPEELEELQDVDLVYDTQKSLEGHIDDWKEWKSVLERYPDKFTAEMLTLEEFTWIIRLIGTRTFGKFAPYTTFFPVGELLNHDNVETYYIYLRPGEVADSSQRYSGIVDDSDHDARIHEINKSVELNNEALCVLNYFLNQGFELEIFQELKATCNEIDHKEHEEFLKHRAYRPPGMDLTESNEKEMRQVTGPNERYEKGSEVYMSYGRNSNRQLLSVYGFSLKQNKFNFAIFKTQFKNLLDDVQKASSLQIENFSVDMYVKFKLKKKILCCELLNVIRKLWWVPAYTVAAFFKPKELELEAKVIEHALKLLNKFIGEFPTTYEHDLQLLSSDIPLRKYFAVMYRSQVKEIIKNQIEFLAVALQVVKNANTFSVQLDDEKQIALETYLTSLRAD